MKQKTQKDALRKRRLVAVVASVLLFIGVFSFLYWFILFPLVWSALAAQDWPPYWFNIYSGLAFLLWAAVVALALLLLWYNREKVVPVQSSPVPIKGIDWKADGPEYLTKLALVQPDDASEKARKVLLGSHKSLDKISKSSCSIPTQLDDDLSSSQDNSSTQSLQTVIPKSHKENNPVDITRKVIPAKNNVKKISCTESESSVEALPVTIPSSRECVMPDSEKSGVMLRKKPGLKLELKKETEDSGPAPLSPRELFFKDLLKKAEDGRARARSQQMRLNPKQESDYRKSTPASAFRDVPAPPVDNTVRIVAQSPKSVDPDVAHPRISSEEYFIAQVSPTKENTSEVHLFISDHSIASAPAIQWKLVSESDELAACRSPHVGKMDDVNESE